MIFFALVGVADVQQPAVCDLQRPSAGDDTVGALQVPVVDEVAAVYVEQALKDV